ncbi:MAG: CHAT domain-containing protein [Methylococcales bacterium]
MVYLFRFIVLVATANVVFATPNIITTQEFEIRNGHAEKAFQHGDFENAIVHWLSTADVFASRGETAKQITALIRLSDAYQAMGQNAASIIALNAANTLTDKLTDQRQKINIFNSLSAAYSAAGKHQRATVFVQQAIEKARAANAPGLLAATLNNQGNLLVRQKKLNQAVEAYSESIQLADSSGNQMLAAKASVNSVIAAFEMGIVDTIEVKLLIAQAHLEKIADDHNKAFHWISLGQIAQRLSVNDANQRLWQPFAHHAFKQASAIGKRISDARAISYATGYLGDLYAAENRYDEALQLTRQAIFAIETINAPEILYRWQWQTGQILKAKSEPKAAIQAYQQAINTLQLVRQDFTVRQLSTSSFREEIGPLYLELADLLLQSNDTLSDQDKIQHNLVAARNTMEQLKAAELQDYFKDDCVVSLQKKLRSLETIDQLTAAIYPILLADRTEILLSLPEGIKRFTIPVSRADVTQQVRLFRQNLENRTTREYLPQAQQLYQWLIAPLQSTLNAHQIETLIMVPDEFLRTIPMAALHDGEAFLIEKYAIANTPSLSLTDPKPLDLNKIHVLASGLSEAVQGFSPLPHVAEELANIQKTLGGQVLLDNAFLLNRIQKELKNTSYNIVHIASHGQFKNNTQENFVLTFDKKLNMDALEQLIGQSRFRDKPVELLVLSACQTAAGDDRAALGLAGIAIKAGARSAVATLWFINDLAAADLVTEFYRQLKATHTSKAQALQKAQIHLIKKPAYHHPYFWSPFLLIGNWL